MLEECEAPCPLHCGHSTDGGKLVDHLDQPGLLGIHLALLLSWLLNLNLSGLNVSMGGLKVSVGGLKVSVGGTNS